MDSCGVFDGPVLFFSDVDEKGGQVQVTYYVSNTAKLISWNPTFTDFESDVYSLIYNDIILDLTSSDPPGESITAGDVSHSGSFER